MDCPKCKLINPDTALRCDCGYNFSTRQMENSYCYQSNQGMASVGFRFANFIVDIILSGIVYYLILSEEPSLFMFYLFCYYGFFESVFQRTPAKFITGTKVLMLDGTKPNFNTIAARTVSRFVPFEPLSGNKGTWWHDRWTQTLVVRTGTFKPFKRAGAKEEECPQKH